MSGFVNSKSYPWALTGIFAAFHLILSIIPAFPGVGGGAISLGMISGPLVGFLLGPIYGTISVLIGSILGIWLNPTVPLLGPFSVIPPTVGALVAASIRGKGKKPLLALAAMAGSFVLFLISPIGISAIGFLWLHSIATLSVLLFLIPKVSDSFDVKEGSLLNFGKLFVALWLLSFIAVMADHLIGSGIGIFYFVYVFEMPIADLEFIFMSIVLLVYPIERLVMCTILAVVLFGVHIGLARSEFRVPLIQEDSVGYLELSPDEVG